MPAPPMMTLTSALSGDLTSVPAGRVEGVLLSEVTGAMKPDRSTLEPSSVHS